MYVRVCVARNRTTPSRNRYDGADSARRALLAAQDALRAEVGHLATAHEHGVARAETLLREQQRLRREMEDERNRAALALADQRAEAEEGVKETAAKLRDAHVQELRAHAREAEAQLEDEVARCATLERNLAVVRAEAAGAREEVQVRFFILFYFIFFSVLRAGRLFCVCVCSAGGRVALVTASQRHVVLVTSC